MFFFVFFFFEKCSFFFLYAQALLACRELGVWTNEWIFGVGRWESKISSNLRILDGIGVGNCVCACAGKELRKLLQLSERDWGAQIKFQKFCTIAEENVSLAAVICNPQFRKSNILVQAVQKN